MKYSAKPLPMDTGGFWISGSDVGFAVLSNSDSVSAWVPVLCDSGVCLQDRLCVSDAMGFGI